MRAKVAINGLGRIGRAALKIVLATPELELVAVNDIAAPQNLAYLLKYDSVYGRYEKTITLDHHALIIDGKRYALLTERDPAQLPWSQLGIDLVFECTGRFTKREDLEKHIHAGARNAILSAPAQSAEVVTVVHGVNQPDGSPHIIACASCTTNCIAPIIEVLGRRIGIQKALMTTVHAYTASQSIVDSPNTSHPRRGRAGAANLVPTSTGAARATTQALPQYQQLFDGVAVRAPVPVGSLADITALTTRKTTVAEINRIFQEEAESERYRQVLGVSQDPLVSSDIIKDPRASIIDLGMTRVVDGDLVKVMSWYDNEWGFTSQMVREGVAMARTLQPRPDLAR